MRYPVSRVVDLLDPALNDISNMDVDEARRRVLRGDAADVRAIDGSFALVASEGTRVRLARSLDRPMRYFLAKRHEGPALYRRRSHRRDAAGARRRRPRGPVPSELHAHGAGALRRRAGARRLSRSRSDLHALLHARHATALPPDLDEIGRRYIGALADEIAKWLRGIEARDPGAPIGVAFSGGIDSGAVFLLTYHAMLQLGPVAGAAQGVRRSISATARTWSRRARFLADTRALDLSRRDRCGALDDLDVDETLRVLEDYKPLDVECAAMGLRLCRGIRERYPEWRYLADGDGGDENLKDYPIEENPELTIRSVVDNLMLYQEGWGVGRIKHSLTYSGGLSRSYARTYAPARRYGFEGFSPFTRPDVIEVAEGDPVRRAHRLRRADALRAQGRDRRRGRQGGHRHRHAGRSRSAASSTAPCRRDGAARRISALDERGYRRAFDAFYVDSPRA